MLSLLMFLFVGALGYLSAALLREYRPPTPLTATTGWLASAVITLLRIVLLYGGVSLLAIVPPPGRLLVLLLLVDNVLVESKITGMFRASPATFTQPSLALGLLLVLTSIPWAFAWAWVRSTRARVVEADPV